jgi:hypothetical protein
LVAALIELLLLGLLLFPLQLQFSVPLPLADQGLAQAFQMMAEVLQLAIAALQHGFNFR